MVNLALLTSGKQYSKYIKCLLYHIKCYRVIINDDDVDGWFQMQFVY